MRTHSPCPVVIAERKRRADANKREAEGLAKFRRASVKHQKRFGVASNLIAEGKIGAVARAVETSPDLRMAVVPSPITGQRSPALKSLRDDPLGRMAKRHQISDAQEQAGLVWQRDYEAAEIGGVKAIDTTRESVDGRRFVDPFDDRRKQANKRLAQYRVWLGETDFDIVEQVLGKRMFLDAVAISRGMNATSDSRDMKYLARRFRDALDKLAFKLGLKETKAYKIGPNRPKDHFDDMAKLVSTNTG